MSNPKPLCWTKLELPALPLANTVNRTNRLLPGLPLALDGLVNSCHHKEGGQLGPRQINGKMETSMSAADSSVAGRHLSQIETVWPILRSAHAGAPGEVNAAQETILLRYRPAVFRYLMACLGNLDQAEEIYQEFALRLVRGDFRNADPNRGRFRDLLKSSLYHLMIDHLRRKKKQESCLEKLEIEPAVQLPIDSDRHFLDAWRADLLNRSWEGLAEEENRTSKPLYTVLHLRAEKPDHRSAQLAEELGLRFGKPLSPEWVRKWLLAARDKFADLLLAEVGASLRNPTLEIIEEELIDLGLFEYCRVAVAKKRAENQDKTV
jgi:RNA polymerase sigma-70 factor (ECF subfamily)